MSRGFSRGSPPPPGSFEYMFRPDHWDPEIYRRKYGSGSARTRRASTSGAEKNAVGFTDLDATQNWFNYLDRSVKQARRVHGDKILSRDDEREWDDFYAKWRTFSADLGTLPFSPSMHSKQNKHDYNDFVSKAHVFAKRFGEKGVSAVPVPYAGDLLLLLRTMPKKLTAAEMSSKLRAGQKCGERMLDSNTTWYDWITSRNHLPLKRAIADAGGAADIYDRSRASRATYSPGDPAYDEFLRRLAKIWIEAAGLYGIVETQATADAQLKDDVENMPKMATSYTLWLLGLAGAAYLGAAWLLRTPSKNIVVGVPDAYQPE